MLSDQIQRPPAVSTVVRKQSGDSRNCPIKCDDRNAQCPETAFEPCGPHVSENEAIGSILLRSLGVCSAPLEGVPIDVDTVEFFADLAVAKPEPP